MKQDLSQTESSLSGKGMKIAIISSEFNKEIGDKLIDATIKELGNLKAEKIAIYKVPGALEIPVVAKNLIQKKSYDAIIALGTIIKGETPHFHHVSRESIHALSVLAIQTGVPVISGILVGLNEKQALDRVDRGTEFARTAIQTIHTIKNI